MTFRRRTPLDLAGVPDELLREEALRREMVVIPPAAGKTIARVLARPAERVIELEALLAVEREGRVLAVEVAFGAFERGQRAAAEARVGTAITALGDLGFAAREVEAWYRAGFGRVGLTATKNEE